MEREKHERLSAKEKELEKEKMKQQLIDMGIEDAGEATFEQLKKWIDFLSNSETTPSVAADNKHTQKKDNERQHSDNECLLAEQTIEIDGSQEQQQQQQQQAVVTSRESPKIARTPSLASPTVGTPQERKERLRSVSPESLSNSPDIFDFAQTRKDSENNAETTSPSEKQQQQQQQHEQQQQSGGANWPVPGTKTAGGAQERREKPSTDTKAMQYAAQSNYHQRHERWRMNPFDVCINENDVPLRQPKRRLAMRKSAPLFPAGCRNNKYTSEQQDQIKRALGLHLREMADMWYSWQRPANAKFEWGAPIEVGTANGGLDRKPITEPKTTEPSKAECTYRDNYERSSKRKANSLIARCANLNKGSSSDEGDQYDFARVKKKKIKPSDDEWSDAPVVDKRASQQQERAAGRHEQAAAAAAPAAATPTATTPISRQQHDGVGDVCIDDEDVRSPRRRKTENEEENDRWSPVLNSSCPKRQAPCTPKARPGLSRIRSGNTVPRLSLQRINVHEETRNLKRDNTLTDEEICRKLEVNSDEEEVTAILRKEMEMEARSPKETRPRPQGRRMLYTDTNTLKDVTVSVTRKEENENKQQRGSKEKRANRGKPRKNENKAHRNKNVNWEQLMEDDDDDDDDDEETDKEPVVAQNGNRHDKAADSASNINCPICNKLFPPDQIENHAADCDQFEMLDEEDVDDLNYKCCMCNQYKTTNAVEFQLHIRQCRESRENKKLFPESDDVDIVTVSPPLRTYKPSKLKATSSPEIDVMDQSSSHSRTRVFTKKRKH